MFIPKCNIALMPPRYDRGKKQTSLWALAYCGLRLDTGIQIRALT
jgi:hypothetical protein